MNKSKETVRTFEDSITALERIVGQLQSGDLPLDRALCLFEEGVALSRQCQSQLEAAERKVEILLREKGDIRLAPFEAERGDKAAPVSSDKADIPF